VKTESQIRQKIKQVVFRHRKKYVEKHLKQHPCNCKFNEEVKLKTPSHGLHVIRKCSYKMEDVDQTNLVCDRNFGGLDLARKCPYFAHKHSAEDLKRKFASRLGLDNTPVSLGELARDFPDVVALMWVLDSQKKGGKAATEDTEANSSLMLLMPSGTEEPEHLPEAPLLEHGSDE